MWTTLYYLKSRSTGLSILMSKVVVGYRAQSDEHVGEILPLLPYGYRQNFRAGCAVEVVRHVGCLSTDKGEGVLEEDL